MSTLKMWVCNLKFSVLIILVVCYTTSRSDTHMEAKLRANRDPEGLRYFIFRGETVTVTKIKVRVTPQHSNFGLAYL